MEPPASFQYHDETNAKRFHDAVASARLSLTIEEVIARRYITVALEDCFTPGVIYETRDEAIRHWPRTDPNQVIYFQIPVAVPSVKECDRILWYVRTAYKANNYRPAGHHEGHTLILPQTLEGYTTL